MPGTFSPPPNVKETAGQRSQHASRHVRHARAVTHAGIANPRWRGKRSRHSQRMRNPHFYVSGKRPIVEYVKCVYVVLTKLICYVRWYMEYHVFCVVIADGHCDWPTTSASNRDAHCTLTTAIVKLAPVSWVLCDDEYSIRSYEMEIR